MAKLAIDRASIVFGKKNWEIFIPNREIGRFSLYYQKSGDLPKNRETWKLCFKLPFSFLLLDTRGNRFMINKTIPLVFVGNGEGAKCVTSVTFVSSVTSVTSVTMINQTKYS